MDRRKRQVRDEVHERVGLSGRLLTHPPSEAQDPAIPLDGEHERAAAALRWQGQPEDPLPVGRRVVRNREDRARVAHVDADGGRLRHRVPIGLQEREGKLAASRRVHDQVGLQGAAGAARIRVDDALDGSSPVARRDGFDPAAVLDRHVGRRAHEPAHRRLQPRTGDRVAVEAEVSWRQPAASRFPQDVDIDLDAHRAGTDQLVLEARKDLRQGTMPPGKKHVHVLSLRDPGSGRSLVGQVVPLQDEHLVEAIGEHARRGESSHSGSHDHGSLADVGHPHLPLFVAVPVGPERYGGFEVAPPLEGCRPSDTRTDPSAGRPGRGRRAADPRVHGATPAVAA
jgi:hypothetical protein